MLEALAIKVPKTPTNETLRRSSPERIWTKGERQPLNNAQSKNQSPSSDNELKEFSDATLKRQRGNGPKIKVLFKTSDLQLN